MLSTPTKWTRTSSYFCGMVHVYCIMYTFCLHGHTAIYGNSTDEDSAMEQILKWALWFFAWILLLRCTNYWPGHVYLFPLLMNTGNAHVSEFFVSSKVVRWYLDNGRKLIRLKELSLMFGIETSYRNAFIFDG